MESESKVKRLKLEPIKATQSPMPLTAAAIIAQFFNPHELLMAALVCKSWYACFTSDTAWDHYDVHGLGRGICSDYLKTKGACERKDWECCFDKYGPPTHTRNLYHMLASFCQTRWLPSSTFNLDWAPKSFFWILSRIENRGYLELNFLHVNPLFHSDQELVYALLAKGFGTQGLHPMYEDDRAAALQCKSWTGFYAEDDSDWPAYFSPQLMLDVEVVLHAVRIDYIVYQELEIHMQENAEVFCAYAEVYMEQRRMPLDTNPFSYAPDSICGDRELVLEWLPFFPHALRDISEELQADWLVVWEALGAYPGLAKILKYKPPDIPAAILAQPDKVYELFELEWMFPLYLMPEPLRYDPLLLELSIEKLACPSLKFDWLGCGMLRRLAAMAPLDLELDYTHIVAAFKIPFGEKENHGSREEVRAIIEEHLGPVPSHEHLESSDVIDGPISP